MTNIETICQNCVFFHPDRGAVVSRFSAVFKKREDQLGKGLISAEDGGNAGGNIYMANVEQSSIMEMSIIIME